MCSFAWTTNSLNPHKNPRRRGAIIESPVTLREVGLSEVGDKVTWQGHGRARLWPVPLLCPRAQNMATRLFCLQMGHPNSSSDNLGSAQQAPDVRLNG